MQYPGGTSENHHPAWKRRPLRSLWQWPWPWGLWFPGQMLPAYQGHLASLGPSSARLPGEQGDRQESPAFPHPPIPMPWPCPLLPGCGWTFSPSGQTVTTWWGRVSLPLGFLTFNDIQASSKAAAPSPGLDLSLGGGVGWMARCQPSLCLHLTPGFFFFLIKILQ